MKDIQFRPITYSPIKIIAIFIVIIALSFLTYQVSIQATISLLIYLLFQFGYFKVIHHPFILHLLYTVEPEIDIKFSKYAITKYRIQDSFHKKKVYIANIHYQHQQIKFFTFQGNIYHIQHNKISALTQLDTIRYISLDNIAKLLNEGLTNIQIQINQEIFGQNGRYTCLNWLSFMKKKFYDEIEWILILTYIQIEVIIFQANLGFVLILLATINISSFIIISITCLKQFWSFKEQYEKLYQKSFRVFREKKHLQVKITQILIGDIIFIETSTNQSQKDDYFINFKCCYIGPQAIQLKQGCTQKKITKQSIPHDHLTNLHYNNFRKYIIQPFSSIEKDSLKEGCHLLVLDKNHIFRYIQQWSYKSLNNQYKSLQFPIFKSIFKLFIIKIIILVIKILILQVIISQSLEFNFNQNIISSLCMLIIIFPSLIYFLLQLNHFTAYLYLSYHHLNILSSNIANAGLLSHVHINTDQMFQLTFKEILYKNRIFDPRNPIFQPDKTTLKNGQIYESLRAIILYISMGYFEAGTYLSQIYKKYSQYFDYSDSLGQYKDIEHKSSSTSWSLQKIDEENSLGIRSWRIKYKARSKYIISECKISQYFNYELIINSEQRLRINNYSQIGLQLLQEGKQIRLILFKQYKGDSSNADQRQELPFADIPRQQLQKDMQFGCFIIFDNAISTSFYQMLQEMRLLSNNQKPIFSFSGFTNHSANKVVGIQHILQNAAIYYEIDDETNAKLVQEELPKGTSVISSYIYNQKGLISSDLSISIKYKDFNSECFAITDIQIPKIQDYKKLLLTGNWMMQNRMQIIKKIQLLLAMNIATCFFISKLYPHIQFKRYTFWNLISIIIFIILPLIMTNIITISQNLQTYTKCLKIITVHYIIQIVCLLIINFLLFKIISQSKICIANDSGLQRRQFSNLLMFRIFDDRQMKENCDNLPIFFVGVASIILNCLYYSENQWKTNTCSIYRIFLFLMYLSVMHLAHIPHLLILSSVAMFGLLFLISIIIKCSIPQKQSKSIIQQRIKTKLRLEQVKYQRNSLYQYL